MATPTDDSKQAVRVLKELEAELKNGLEHVRWTITLLERWGGGTMGDILSSVGAGLSTPSPKAPAPSKAGGPKQRGGKKSGTSIADHSEAVLREEGEALHLAILCERIMERGAKVGGKSPKNSLRGTLARYPEKFRNIGGNTWVVVGSESDPEAPDQPHVQV